MVFSGTVHWFEGRQAFIHYLMKSTVVDESLSSFKPMYCSREYQASTRYINMILDCLQSKKYCEAIMDDLLLFTPSKEAHMSKLEDLLRALLSNGLKMSPKKCQLFKTSLQYMGNEIFIENKKVCVKPLRNRLGAIQKLQPPKIPKGCRSFVGVVNFLSIFCLELQKLLKPIYNLTRKGRPFNWGKEQQDSFEEIKC